MVRLPGRLTALLIFLAPLVASACEGCKSTAQAGGSPNAIGEAFGWSIYFMLAVPALLMFGLVRLMIRQCRALQQQHAHLGEPAAPPRPAGEFEALGAAIAAR